MVIGEMGLVDSCWKDRFLTYMIGDFFKLGFLENTDFSGNFLMNMLMYFRLIYGNFN